ncbi:Hemolysin A [bioreactor metagenome]|uniref:Hemolysin A n=1 Tax=bioreactor metagenome TaxID=1076179 RepID=A0A645BSE3_9ZZZZ
MVEGKIRLDVLVVEQNIAPSREKAREYILSGKIFVDDKVERKCGRKVSEDVKIELRGEVIPYVSRGGLKLEKAIKTFSINLKDMVCLDIGASTGGFTHCMLNFGAKKVYAIDVGSDQLACELKQDERVVSMENTNVKNLTLRDVGELSDFASIDVSFISLDKVIPSVLSLIHNHGTIVALVKPQFEAGIGRVNKKGVVKDNKIHIEVLYKVVTFLKENNLKIIGLDYSSIKGPNGNIEYLIYFTKDKSYIESFNTSSISDVVLRSHEILNSEDI